MRFRRPHRGIRLSVTRLHGVAERGWASGLCSFGGTRTQKKTALVTGVKTRAV